MKDRKERREQKELQPTALFPALRFKQGKKGNYERHQNVE
jgi:hypothetical protein